MLDLDINKMKKLVQDDFISNKQCKWLTDNDNNLLYIKIHNEYSTLYIFWLYFSEDQYMILFDARKQRIYIKKITDKTEISNMISETLITMSKIVFSTYKSCIKLSDDFERVNN